MKRIRLAGYVGWDITPEAVQAALTEAGGAPIEIHLTTEGGLISDGIAIYDLIDKYEGEKVCLMGGLVASIGSYIATACPKVIAQDITVYMIHNAHNSCYGDHKAMTSNAVYLEKQTEHIADRLSRFTGKKKEDLLEMMDAETWLYGKDILDAGFATDYIETGKAKEDPENVLTEERFKYHERLKSVAALRGEVPPPKPKEEKMDRKEFLEKAKGFIKSGEFTFDDAVELFGARDQIITEKQKETLNVLGEDDPAELRAKAKAAEIAALNVQLDEAFGKEGTLRTYAQGCVERGMSIEDIQKDPVAIDLAAKRADSSVNVIEPAEGDDENKDDDGDVVIARY